MSNLEQCGQFFNMCACVKRKFEFNFVASLSIQFDVAQMKMFQITFHFICY